MQHIERNVLRSRNMVVMSALLGFLTSAYLNLGAGLSTLYDASSMGRREARGLWPCVHEKHGRRETMDEPLFLRQGLLRLRGGSRAAAAGRAKAKYLAQKLSSQVDAHRRKSERKIREKMIAGAESAASKRQAAEERIERELSMIEDQPFDPATDAASVEADERRSEMFRSKYAPGQIVELEDSEEWRRETEGDPSTKMHTMDVFRDQTELIRAHNERHAKGLPEAFTETGDEWDNVRPDGKMWGEEEVPKLVWDQASRFHHKPHPNSPSLTQLIHTHKHPVTPAPPHTHAHTHTLEVRWSRHDGSRSGTAPRHRPPASSG